ncbi:inositol-3-phosphate synthase [Dyadobacter chenhuakuii]|uniref:Myo-inositol-1-phosphate synthase n=1 Tax=Dyadobacter chenhuakuii TaxID=2909339 RepID=A0ABY4XNS1_9BACT|nr:Myo-inositol-1-phosphate synthase [Dyadobacter chenhuakuii]MCF2494721.1 Myo-inositol-1-phosphate synthase [Dyadobacter chenhuakuii]USJ31958.1 Myo-inositol-1-phosphate synthase [Dyadobacter chenhuakuii]
MSNRSGRIKVAIVGVGNCASSLVQGVEYYTTFSELKSGLMADDIGGYKAADIEFVCAFEVDERKIGLPLREAIFAKPNCTIVLNSDIKSDAPVYPSPVLDGVSPQMAAYPVENRFVIKSELAETDLLAQSEQYNKDLVASMRSKIVAQLRQHEAEVLINYLPVGSQLGTEFYAEICLELGISLVNCIPVFIASDPQWEQRFVDAGIPIIGDDMRSQFGASIVSQMLQELAFERGHHVKAHIQRNVGGNTDFLNMEDKARLKSKKISKENVIRAQNDIRGISTQDSFLHAGPSEYIAYYGDNKVANFRLELEGFMGAPVILDAQLSVQDSPNSAGVVIDAIRYVYVAREMGLVGALRGPSASTQKTPPEQMMFSDAIYECHALANRKLTDSTRKQLAKTAVAE